MTGEAAVFAALEKCADTITTTAGGGRWEVSLANGVRLGAQAWVDDGWLGLEAALDGRPPPVWTLLAWNAGLSGSARFVPGARGRGVGVRADMCLDADVDVALRVRDACAGLLAAQAAVAHGRRPCMPPVPAPVVDLPALCRGAGWNGVARDRGVLVELAVPGAFHQAVVESRAGAGVVVSVPLADAVSVDAATAVECCREAVGVLCLRTSGALRFVRAVGDDVVGARFEVVLGAEPSAAEVGHACAALSVACRMAAREVAVLRADEAVARVYLGQWDRQTKEGAAS